MVSFSYRLSGLDPSSRFVDDAMFAYQRGVSRGMADPASSCVHLEAPSVQSAAQAARFGSTEKYCARHSAVQACRFASQLTACAAAGATTATQPMMPNENAVNRMAQGRI